MSKCISAKGEYSEHAPGEEEEFVCGRCYVVDEEAMRAEIERLRADRPSVTDNARAEAVRQYPALNADDETLTYPRSAVREHARGGFVAGYEAGWAAGRAETPVIHLSNPDDGASFCDQPVTIITEAGDTRPVCQTCHRGAMKHAHARAETTTATDEDAVTEVARLIDSCIPDDVPGYRYRYAVKAAEAMAARGLLATARTRPTRTAIARAICESTNPGIPAAWNAYRDQWLQDADAVLALFEGGDDQ